MRNNVICCHQLTVWKEFKLFISEMILLVCAGLEIYGILFILAIPNLKWREKNTSSKLILQIKMLTIFSVGVKNCMNARHEEALGLNTKQFTFLWLHINGLNMINSLCIRMILNCWVYQLNEYICCWFFWLISKSSTKSDTIPVGFILLQQTEIITDAKKTDFLLIWLGYKLCEATQ